MNQPNFRGALFDLDGTLVQSHLDFAAIRRDTGFPDGVGLLEHLSTLESKSDRDDALDIIHRHERDGAQRAHWMPGARVLLQQLADKGCPVGIVTRNSRSSAELMINNLGIPCDQLVAREDAPAKPDPTGLLDIAARWGVRPQDLFYVGDHLFDIKAARSAGMVACLYAPDGESPFAEHADRVISEFSQLAAWVQEIKA